MNASASSLNRAHEWIIGDDTGVSSKAIWAVMLGVKPQYRYENHPYDPADLGRCLRLLKAFPEWVERLQEMSSVSVWWSRLVKHWQLLEQSMADEVGIDWSKGRSAPKTYALMQLVLEGKLP